MDTARRVKRAIIKSGFKPSHSLEMILNLFKLGKWLKENKCEHHYRSREELYQHIGSLADSKPIDYLEFGVFKGKSMRFWTDINSHDDSRFFGFDTFTGLPENWNVFASSIEKGHFDTNGEAPKTDDKRVKYIKGLFQDTVPDFLNDFQPREQLVVHCDSDLYSSTHYVLTMIDKYLCNGTILLFDDFSVANHEFRAFTDYTSSYRKKYEVIATAEIAWEKVAIRML